MQVTSTPDECCWLYSAIFFKYFWGSAKKVCCMWPVRHAMSNWALQAVPTSCVPNVWQEGGMNSVPVLVCLAARHFSLSNQTVQLEWDPYSCLFLSPPEALSPSYEKHRRTLVCTSFPPAQHRASSVRRYTYLETITREKMVQSVPSLFLSAAATLDIPLSFFSYYSPKTKSQFKWAFLQSYREPSESGRSVFQG